MTNSSYSCNTQWWFINLRAQGLRDACQKNTNDVEGRFDWDQKVYYKGRGEDTELGKSGPFYSCLSSDGSWLESH